MTAGRYKVRVEAGQRYTGWGRTWEVMRVIPTGNGGHVVDARDVNDPDRTIRWPIAQFKGSLLLKQDA